MNELTEELDALRAILRDIATLWASNAGCDFTATTMLGLAMLVRDGVRADRDALALELPKVRARLSELESSGLFRMGIKAVELKAGAVTPTAHTIRELFREADAAVAADVASGTYHKGTALATLYQFREAVRPYNAALAESLIAEQTEKAEVRA